MLKNFIPAEALSGQEEYYDLLREKDIVFASGNAGSGKSFLAINEAVRCLLDTRNRIRKIIVIRPYIFTRTENLGALPGSLDEKIMPFVAAIRDNLEVLMSRKVDIDEVMEKIEYLTLSTIRGRSLHNSYIIVEEAQNVPLEGDGMLTIITRMGKNSRMVIAGDLSQCDIHRNDSSFLEAVNALRNLEKVGYAEMNDIKCTHRNPIIGSVIQAFNDFRNNPI